MKLVIQIPCFNEENTLAQVFVNMPKTIPGIAEIEYQIIDDGSTDKTVEVAKQLGVHHIVSASPRGKNRKWLGRAFKLGIENALKQGADIVVNTDGDNQYPSERIADLVEPIISGRADIVIGDRKPHQVKEYSILKRFLQRLGSRTTQFMSGQQVPDAVSGFRAYSKKALAKINIVTQYTYTVDTLMQAHKKGLEVEWLPIDVNEKTRESRLISSLYSKVKKSGGTIIRMYTIYEPFKTFSYLGLLFLLPGFGLLLRYAIFWLQGASEGKVQSIVVGGVMVILGVQFMALGMLADSIKVNRQLIEDLLEMEKHRMYDRKRERQK